MGRVGFANKEKLKESGLPAINSWRDDDANEVKSAINDNADKIDELVAGGIGLKSVGYPELKDVFVTEIDLGVGLNIDWDIAPLYYKTLTVSPTAITQSNYKVCMGKMLMLTGDFSYSIEYCDIIVDEENYDGSLWNLFQIFCIDDTDGSEKFTCNHVRTFAI